MPASRPCVVDLPNEQAAYVDGLVRSGRYSSSSEVVEAGLRALQNQDDATDEWLRRDVVPVLKAMQADPSRGIPAQEVFDAIRTLHGHRLKTAGRAV